MQVAMNEASPIVVAAMPRPKRSLPLRFSLWTLFLVVAAACIGAAWYGMRQREREAMEKAAALAQQVEAQRDEINRLRAEIGYLTIGDRTKVHVLGQRVLDHQHLVDVAALDELHHDEGGGLARPRVVVDLNDARMAQGSDGPRLAMEVEQALFVGGLGLQELHRHLAIE